MVNNGRTQGSCGAKEEAILKKKGKTIFFFRSLHWAAPKKIAGFFFYFGSPKKVNLSRNNLFIWSSFVRVEKHREDQNLTDSNDISLSFFVMANGTNLQVYLPTED